MPLTDSLISYWRLDEASGTRVDAVAASANDLTDVNTVTSATGKINLAAQFTAANSEALTHVDNAGLTTGDIDYTIAAWINTTTTTGTRPAVTKDTSGAREYSLYMNTAKIQWNVCNGAGTVVATVDSLITPTINTWYFVIAEHDSVNNFARLYINNGSAIATATSGAAGASATPFRLGTDGFGGARYWDGLIDEVGFWKRLLTTQERTDLYNSGAGLSYDSFIAGQPMALRQSLLRTGAQKIGRGF